MFIAVYGWRVKPGKEEQFRDAWRRGTRQIARIHGGLGSRLHRERDGRFIGVAEWPDYETWKRAFDARMVYEDQEARTRFIDALAEGSGAVEPLLLMEVTDDLLVRSALRPDAPADG